MSLRLLATAALAVAVPAAASAAGPLSLVTRVLVETREGAADGTSRTRLVAPTRATPGDRVVVVLAYRNTGARPLADLVLVDPVPAGVAFRDADGAPGAEVSADGRTFAPLASLRVATAAGTTRAAIAADVTHVRWRLVAPLAPGAGGELRFRATLK